jgi:hypothetical protein
MRSVLLFALLLLFASCSKNYPIELPANEARLVVECYLEDGKPLRALVTESTALLDQNLVPPVIFDAVVTITHDGHTDTLQPQILVDTVRNKGYNYGSNALVKADYHTAERYRIDVYDGKGRHAFGETYFMPPAFITDLTTVRNDDSDISCLTSIGDDPSMKNYYRLILRRNSERDSIQMNSFFSDELVNAQNQIVIRSRQRFSPGDSVYATLFHLTPEYYRFLTTTQSATSALGNPFAASGEVVSNISGGLGVFAALTVTGRGAKVE